MTGQILDADLVLEGGGVKGIGLVGAYRASVDRGYRIRRVAGTSAGAIVGALIAAGMPADRMEKVMRELDYGEFQDKGFLDHLGKVGQGLSVLFDKGIYEGDTLHKWIDEELDGLGVRTFRDLKIKDDPDSALPAERSYRLVVVASDVSRGKMVRLPWDYKEIYGLEPDEQRVSDAVRASMSIPFIYEPVTLTSKDDDGTDIVSYLVDGGMLSNYPIDLFDRPEGETSRWPTFGCKLSARPGASNNPKYKIDGALDLGKALIGTMMSAHDKMHIDDPAVIARTIFIDTFGVKATDFDLEESTQVRLYESGVAAAEKFFGAGWDFDHYLRTYRTPAAAGLTPP